MPKAIPGAAMARVLLILAALVFVGQATARGQSVLVIVADDQRADSIAALGNAHVRTPALDALVARGTSFDRAYCMGSAHGAVCIPSRAMMLTGRSLFHRDEQLDGQDSWPEAFSRLGRATFLTGKWHNGEASATRCFREGRNVFFGGMTDQWNVPVTSFSAGDGSPGLPPPTVAAGVHSAALFGDAAVGFLERVGDEPFFAWVSFTVPHDPRQAPDELRSRYAGREPPPPPNFLPEHPFDNGELAVRDELLLPRPLSRDGVSREIADALACVESLDAQVGRMTAALERTGRLDDTIILFVSDHGLALGSHGLLGKQNLYEHSMRAPAILAGPGVPAGRRVEALCHLQDLVATAGDLAGVPAPAGSEAVSLRPQLGGAPQEPRGELLLAYRHLQRALVTRDWKLVRYPEIGREQLFDLSADPHELHDLVDDPAQASRLVDLRARMARKMREADDPLAAGAEFFAPAARPVPRPPNVVFFLADDLGTGDVAALGSTFAVTPHVDALFARGTRLARHWAGSAVCAPSRCVLMTGLHPGHAAVRSNSEVQPEGQRPMPAGTVTLAGIFREAGYATGGFGKWGLGAPGSASDPLACGFDRFFGYNCQRHAHSFYPTWLRDGRERVPLDNADVPVTASLPSDPPPTAADFARFRGTVYSADRIGAEALDFVRAHKDEPFFLYVPTTLPHVALQVPADEPSLEVHRQRFGAETPYLGGKGYVPCVEPAATLAAMITRMDRDVGRIVGLLEELGIADDTIFVFTSDNGATFPGAGGAATDRMESHGAFRDWKGSPYEGGLRVPAVVVWPGRIAAGASIDVPTGCEDWLPTLLDLAGMGDRTPAGLDGQSLAPLLLGREPEPPPRVLYRELTERRWQAALEHSAAGSWKAVRRARGPDGTEAAPTELYDLAADPGEAHDLAAERSDVVARLEGILDREHVPDPAWPMPFADAAALAARNAEAPRRPNVVFILADDLGWTDLGVQGSGYYRSPNVDRLAADGMRFLAHHACPNCQPTRAALMSGQYGARTGVYTVGNIDRFDWRSRPLRPVDNVTKLPLDRRTIADLVGGAGYATGIFGKWHLGEDVAHHPAARGFDEAIVSHGKHFDFETNPPVEVPPGTYLADFLAERACDFIRRHAGEPFFLYVPHFGVHAPLEAKEELVARFRDLPASAGHRDPVYAAMIASVDESVGRIRACLEAEGIADDTVILFSSDNGGRGGYAREGLRAEADATDNAPLRCGKGSLYEGGVRVPLVVHWPGVTRAGSTTSVPTIHVDLSATILEIAGAAPAAGQPLDGASLVPLLRDPERTAERPPVFQHFPGYLGAGPGAWRTTPGGSVQEGKWKLIEFFEDGRRELYDLDADPGETTDLASRLPDRAEAMHRLLGEWRDRVGAPMPERRDPDGG